MYLGDVYGNTITSDRKPQRLKFFLCTRSVFVCPKATLSMPDSQLLRHSSKAGSSTKVACMLSCPQDLKNGNVLIAITSA